MVNTTMTVYRYVSGCWYAPTVMSNGVLVVDDNESIRRLLHNFVETNTPFKVCGEAENGAEALRMARELQPDLVLVDLTMPGMSGTETATALRRLEPRPKIILFTLHADGVNKELASVFSIDVVLSKTEGISTLATHINALLMPAANVVEDIGNSPSKPDMSGKQRVN
jgi:DNA-binding NarL/FixJ family response regulator